MDRSTLENYIKEILKQKKVKEGTCGYGAKGKLGKKPAGSHLLSKKDLDEDLTPNELGDLQRGDSRGDIDPEVVAEDEFQNYSLLDFFKEMQSFPAAGVDREDIRDASKSKKTVGNTPALQDLLDQWMSGRYDEDPGYLVDELRGLLESVNEG